MFALDEAQTARIRVLLLEELRNAATVLAEQAAAAAQDDDLAAEDAGATWHHRLDPTAQLLDALRWSQPAR